MPLNRVMSTLKWMANSFVENSGKVGHSENIAISQRANFIRSL